MPDPSGLPLAVGAAVLGSAVLHATWNAVAKAIPHRLLASALIGVSFAVVGAVWSVLAPVPSAASWPYLVGSSVLQTVYLLLLTAAYSHGEFRRVYPVARGSAPLLVTIVALTALGERLGPGQLAGIALVIAALAMLASLPRSGADRAGATAGRSALGLALATGVVIAGYTLVDGVGVRQSGSAAGYAAYSLLVHGPMLVLTCLALAGPRRLLGWWRPPDEAGTDGGDGRRRDGDGGRHGGDGGRHGGDGAADRRRVGIAGAGLVRTRHRPAVIVAAGLGGGVLSVAAYAIVLWAQSRASLALVSALRETSVLFAGVIGALLFAERFSARQLLASVGVVAGIALMQLA